MRPMPPRCARGAPHTSVPTGRSTHGRRTRDVRCSRSSRPLPSTDLKSDQASQPVVRCGIRVATDPVIRDSTDAGAARAARRLASASTGNVRHVAGRTARSVAAVGVAAALLVAGGAPSAQAGPNPPPGAAGTRGDWLNADKDGFGTAAAVSSKLWYTLERGS